MEQQREMRMSIRQSTDSSPLFNVPDSPFPPSSILFAFPPPSSIFVRSIARWPRPGVVGVVRLPSLPLCVACWLKEASPGDCSERPGPTLRCGVLLVFLVKTPDYRVHSCFPEERVLTISAKKCRTRYTSSPHISASRGSGFEEPGSPRSRTTLSSYSWLHKVGLLVNLSDACRSQPRSSQLCLLGTFAALCLALLLPIWPLCSSVRPSCRLFHHGR